MGPPLPPGRPPPTCAWRPGYGQASLGFYGSLANLSLSIDPLTQNRCDLAGGNPISFIEWDGHLPFTSGSGGPAIIPTTPSLTPVDRCGGCQDTASRQIFSSAPPTQTSSRTDKDQNQCFKDISTYVSRCLPQARLQVKPELGVCLSPRLSLPLLSECQQAVSRPTKPMRQLRKPSVGKTTLHSAA